MKTTIAIITLLMTANIPLWGQEKKEIAEKD